MTKRPFDVVYKKRPKIPPELLPFVTEKTTIEKIKPGFAKGIRPELTVKPHKKK